MDYITFRIANINDLKDILNLYKQLISFHVELEPNFFKNGTQSKTFVKDILYDPSCCIILACADNEIVGFVVLQIEKSIDLKMLKKYKYVYLTDIVVSKDYQNRKIGSTLIKYSIDWARKNKVDYLELNVWNSNVDAIRLYKQFGFKHKISTMYLDLKEDA